MMKGKCRLNLTIPEYLHRQFKVICSLQGKTMLAEAEKLIQDLVDQHSATGNPYPQMVTNQIKKEMSMEHYEEVVEDEKIISEVHAALLGIQGGNKWFIPNMNSSRLEILMERVKYLFQCEPGSFKDELLKAIKHFLLHCPMKQKLDDELETLIIQLEALKAKLNKE